MPAFGLSIAGPHNLRGTQGVHFARVCIARLCVLQGPCSPCYLTFKCIGWTIALRLDTGASLPLPSIVPVCTKCWSLPEKNLGGPRLTFWIRWWRTSRSCSAKGNASPGESLSKEVLSLCHCVPPEKREKGDPLQEEKLRKGNRLPG